MPRFWSPAASHAPSTLENQSGTAFVNRAFEDIAAIAGLVVGLLGSLLPKNLALPPLAVAFLVGYGVEAFFSRLDDLIAKFKRDPPAKPTSAQEGSTAD